MPRLLLLWETPLRLSSTPEGTFASDCCPMQDERVTRRLKSSPEGVGRMEILSGISNRHSFNSGLSVVTKGCLTTEPSAFVSFHSYSRTPLRLELLVTMYQLAVQSSRRR
jgi:hypothetical protein